MNVLETRGLSVRYRRVLALRDLTISIPSGHIVALVGPNGSGKTTLLHSAVGLVRPTAGIVSVLGGIGPGSQEALDRVAFVAQDAPLYENLQVSRMVELTQNLNRRFDPNYSQKRLNELDIPTNAKIADLSLGQRAQLALTLALARRPELLVLDEPLARLDPLARHAFMQLLIAAVAEEGLSIIFSSHVVSELEAVADYLVVLQRGHVQMALDIESLLAKHLVLSGPTSGLQDLHAGFVALKILRAGRHTHVIALRKSDRSLPPREWEEGEVSLNELVLAYLNDPELSTESAPNERAIARLSLR